MDVRKIENKSLQQGGEDFETAVLSVAANTTVPAGAFLKRQANGKFTVIESTNPPDPAEPWDFDKPVAINPVEITNPGAAADVPFRAQIAGKVRFDMLSVGGQPITDAQADLLRSTAGIIAKKVTDLSWTD